MLVKVFGSAVFGVDATTITVEVNIDKGIGYHLVGLPDNAVKESSHRIAASLKNIGYELPGKKIIINMAPADVKKEERFLPPPLFPGNRKRAPKPKLQRSEINRTLTGCQKAAAS